ncbi:lipase, partial [Conidiobolus coronatus NRRL 28638]
MTAFDNKLIFIGDSLTERGFDVKEKGWTAQIANHFARQYEIVARAYAGYNTKWVQPIVDDIIEADIAPDAEKVQLVTIWFGSNDGAEPTSPHHVPMAEYKQNLINIIKKLRQIPRSSELPLLL